MYGQLTFPIIDRIITYPREMNYDLSLYSMRLRSTAFDTNAKTHMICTNKKYTFKFLAKDVPNVRSLFIVRHGGGCWIPLDPDAKTIRISCFHFDADDLRYW